VDQVERSLLDDEQARRRQSKAAESNELQTTIRRLEDDREQVIASLSGAPGSDTLVVAMDKALLRARLKELNSEIQRLAGAGVSGAASEASTEGAE
jgi:hypothetical protein